MKHFCENRRVFYKCPGTFFGECTWQKIELYIKTFLKRTTRVHEIYSNLRFHHRATRGCAKKKVLFQMILIIKYLIHDVSYVKWETWLCDLFSSLSEQGLILVVQSLHMETENFFKILLLSLIFFKYYFIIFLSYYWVEFWGKVLYCNK